MLDIRNIKTTRLCKFLKHKNAGLYKIIRAIDNHVYELELPKSMKIYLVFHSWLLHLNKSKPLPNQRIKPSSPANVANNIGDDFEYYVKGIEASRYNMRKNDDNVDPSLIAIDHRRKMLQYQILFTSYTNYNDRPKWLDYPMVDDCPNFVVDFHHEYLDAARPH